MGGPACGNSTARPARREGASSPAQRVCANFCFQIYEKPYLRSHRGGSREPAGLRGLRTQVTEAEEGPLELRRGKGVGQAPVGRKGATGKGVCVLLRALSMLRAPSVCTLRRKIGKPQQRNGNVRE